MASAGMKVSMEKLSLQRHGCVDMVRMRARMAQRLDPGNLPLSGISEGVLTKVAKTVSGDF